MRSERGASEWFLCARKNSRIDAHSLTMLRWLFPVASSKTSNCAGVLVPEEESQRLKDIQAKLKQRMHESIKDTLKWLQSVVRGYFQYHAIPDNEQRRRVFRKDVLRLWLRQLRRRSQRSRWTWERFLERPAVQIPFAQIEHPYPSVRFDAKHPR